MESAVEKYQYNTYPYYRWLRCFPKIIVNKFVDSEKLWVAFTFNSSLDIAVIL